MALKPETRFRLKVIDDLRTIPRCKHFTIQQSSIVGTPDILLCVNGRFVAIELKASEDAKVSKMQLFNLEAIAKVGGIGLLVYPQNWMKTLIHLQNISAVDDLTGVFKT